MSDARNRSVARSSSLYPPSMQVKQNSSETSNMLDAAPPPSAARPLGPHPNPQQRKRPQILELHEIFLMHDRRGDNKISISDLGDCLRVMGANPSEAMVEHHMRLLEAGSLQRITFDECLNVYTSLEKLNSKQKAAEEQQFISTLRLLDEDGTGYIHANRIFRLLTQFGEALSEVEVHELLQGRVNEKGMVDYKELVHFIMYG